MVAIPAVVAFNYFSRRVRVGMTQIEWVAHLAVAEVKSSARAELGYGEQQVA
jgi:biopolymer transport protein ExbB/TolQ